MSFDHAQSLDLTRAFAPLCFQTRSEGLCMYRSRYYGTTKGVRPWTGLHKRSPQLFNGMFCFAALLSIGVLSRLSLQLAVTQRSSYPPTRNGNV